MIRSLLSRSECTKWAEISLPNLKHNLNLIQDALPSETQVMGIVKANAYGHNISIVAPELFRLGITQFGVATLGEAIYLKQLVPQANILILGALEPLQIQKAIELNFAFMLYSSQDLPSISQWGQEHNRRARMHVKLDSGMGRVGLLPDEFSNMLPQLKNHPNIEIEGLCTHLATSDLEGSPHTQNQLDCFEAQLKQYTALYGRPKWVHAANSDAIFLCPQSHFNLVRPGLALYGYCSYSEVPLKPVLALKANLTQVKTLPSKHGIGYGRSFVSQTPVKIGILPMGYADGLNRHLAPHLKVNIAHTMQPLLGRISMDQCVVDLSALPQAQRGSTVTLMGGGAMNADQWAQILGTISYEVLTGLGARVPRFKAP